MIFHKISAGDQESFFDGGADNEIGRSLAEAVESLLGESPLGDHELRVIARLGQQLTARIMELKAENERLQAEANERERTLRETAKLLRRNQALTKSFAHGLYTMNSQGDLVEANESFCRMLGYTWEEAANLNVCDWDAQWPAGESELRLRSFIGKSALFETVHRRKDGTLIDVEVCASGEEIEGQGYIFASSRDITERKQAEEELRIAAATFQSHEAIVITDAGSNIIRVNQAFSDITGYRVDEVLGKNPRIMASGRHDRNFYGDMWQRLQYEGLWSGEIWDRRKNGEVFPKRMTITAIRNEQQEVTKYVAIFTDITARKQAEEEILNLAFYDVLTKLPNRRLFFDRFSSALSASALHHDYGAALFLDLDNFKTLNDTLGHDCGDLLLIEVGRRLKSCVRDMDTVARFGGDEFVVLLEALSDSRDAAARKAELVAEKIREALAQPYKLKAYTHHSSPSIGISLFHGNGESVDLLLERADMAMYQAKNSGRNAVCLYDPTMQ